jgi:NAD(P) transhydrogenase subunit alpha
VIVDLAVAQGGNCELSVMDQEVVEGGVRIIGRSNFPATMPRDASTLYARNVLALLQVVMKDGALALDLADEIVSAALVTHEGALR